MKKLGAIFAALGIALIMTVGCNSSGNDSSSTGGTTVGTAQNLFDAMEKMKGGMTEQEVIALAGDPTDKVALGGGENRFEWRDRDGHLLTVTFTGGKVRAWTYK